MKKICVVTGSRAEYGLLRWVMQSIKGDSELSLQLIVTGMHLSPEFGLSYQLIERDGFFIDRKIEMLTSSDTAVGVGKSIGLGIIGFVDALNELKPDLMVILGDRFEILAAAQAAMILKIPVAHLAGGDIASGTFDNTIRHCLTKISSIHFVTHEEARRRVIQLGERPDRVFCFGATSVDNIAQLKLLSKDELEVKLGIKFSKIILLVTFHPLTMGVNSGDEELEILLKTLSNFKSNNHCTIIFTKANADNGGRKINERIQQFVNLNQDAFLFDNLGELLYLSVMKQASIVLGNSSSGIYEAPYLKTATVDIGKRQFGRVAPNSVFHCESDEKEIEQAMYRALLCDFDEVKPIYGNGESSVKIVKKIKELIDDPLLNVKTFIDVNH